MKKAENRSEKKSIKDRCDRTCIVQLLRIVLGTDDVGYTSFAKESRIIGIVLVHRVTSKSINQCRSKSVHHPTTE